MGTGKLSGEPEEMVGRGGRGGNLGMDWHPIQRRVVILLVTSRYMGTGISSCLVDQ